MDALELKDTNHFLRNFGDIHHGIGKKNVWIFRDQFSYI